MDEGTRMTTEKIRGTFCTLFYEYSGSGISFSDYRHVAKYFAHKLNLNVDEPDESDDEFGVTNTSSVDQQFGHSTTTANLWYGLSDRDTLTTREHLLESFKTLSSKWHTFIRGDVTQVQQRAKEVVVPHRSEENPNSGEALPTLATVEDLKGKNDHFEHIVTVHQSRKSVVQLRVFFGDSCAEFKSLELHAAVDNALHTRNDVLAILPTGAGKSLLFFLYASMHTERTSFVIVPTVSLVCDLMRRAKSHGIRCTNDASKVSNEHLVFVTPEAAATSVAVRAQLMQLYCKKRLGTIFVDEAGRGPVS